MKYQNKKEEKSSWNTLFTPYYIYVRTQSAKIRHKDSKRERSSDDIRRTEAQICGTPEEWVRQHFVHYLIEHKGYPQALMANEIQLAIGNKKLRCDSVLYDRSLKPRMIIEYKAPTVNITQKVFDQITIYNMLLHVDYLVVSNGIKHYCCRMDYENQKYLFLDDIPNYQEIIT